MAQDPNAPDPADAPLAPEDERADHGEFQLRPPQENVLILQLHEAAAKNTVCPGQGWNRLHARIERDGQVHDVYKTIHIDLNRRRLTVAEFWGKEETARRTVDLDAKTEVPVAPVPPLGPGPEATSFVRVPWKAADPAIDDDARAWAMERAEEEAAGVALLPRRARLLGDGFHEFFVFPQMLAPGPAPETAATVAALRRRPGVERVLVEGWHETAPGEGEIWILDVTEAESLWLARRPFVRRPGQLARWNGPWSKKECASAAELDPALRSAIQPAPGASALPHGPPSGPPEATLGMRPGVFPDELPLPDAASGWAQFLGQDFERGFASGGLRFEGVRAFVVRGRDFEHWELNGEFPMGLDDMLRAVCARGEVPQALVVARLQPVFHEGEPYRALVTQAECAGKRASRALLMMMDAAGTVVGLRSGSLGEEEPGDDGWLGVAPVTELSLQVQG